MIEKVTLKTVKIYDKPFTKEGEAEKPPYTYKKGKNIGKNFVMVNIQTEEHGDDWYGTPEEIGGRKTQLTAGQQVVLNLTETPSADGKKVFKNFAFPSQKELEIYKQFNPES